MSNKTVKDIIFIVGLAVIIWIGLKLLIWTMQNVFFIAILVLIVYFLYRMGVFKKVFKK